MALRLHNTLTRALERLAPLEEGVVRMYTCGPTVYERAHIGNFRTFLWEDLLRRTLRWKGYRVIQVMNLTDVDDKTIQAALARGVTLEEVTEPVIRAFREDWETLGLEPVEHAPRATRHVDAMIELVRRLEANGLTYRADGSVYFAIARFPGYGRLAGLDPDAPPSSARARSDEEYDKDDPRDFVLWKGGDRGEEARVAAWDSPWGPGRPGWHLECSAMAMQYLGETLDIHTGGVDNIFPHHTNEIAQSEGATGKPFARYWLHAAHLLVEGAKMSKSLGNDYTVPYLLERGHRPSAIRYLLLGGHYRAQLNFTREGLATADRALERLVEFRRRLLETAGDVSPDAGPTRAADERGAKASDAGGGGAAGSSDGGPRGQSGDREGAAGEAEDPLPDAAARARAAFEAALDDDLNVSEALAATFELVREGNQALDAGLASPGGARGALAMLDDFDTVFGVLSLRDRERRSLSDELRAWVEERIEARAAARSAGDYALADRIREEVAERGFVLEDTPAGTRWKVRDVALAATQGGGAGEG